MRPFVAIDFETANEQRCSACSVGLVKYDEAGQISDRFHSLIRPHPEVDYFSPVNTWIHGLTEDDVADAPQWSEILDEIRAFIDDLPIVAHYMPFDSGVLRGLAEIYESVSSCLCVGLGFIGICRSGRGRPRPFG